MREARPAARVGRYQLVSPIGAGGMGRVWVALDTAAPSLRLVAVKTALGHEDGSREFWAMLADEAALASRIDHPNVCATYELGHEDGIHYLVMEWSDGASLRDVLDASPEKRIAPELAAFIGASVAAGLHAAHELVDDAGQPLNVVHRDVSPQNVLISMGGHVRIADFGVAKARGQQHRPTETGEVKGKLSYMSPEQVTSKNIDRRADVFALGCVLYEATLGVRPFHGADALATMYKILEQDLVRPREIDPDYPEQLEAVLVRALAKNADDRYPTAEDFRAGLLDYLSSTRRYFSDKHVAELVNATLGDKLRERNRAIVASAEQLRKGETDPARLASPPPAAPNKTLTPEGGIERSVSVATRERSLRRKWIAVSAAALLAALAFAGRSLWSEVGTAPVPEAVAAASREPSADATSPASAPSALAATPIASAVPDSPAPIAAAAASVVPVPSVAVEPQRATAPRVGARVTARPVTSSLVTAPKPTGRKPRPIDHTNPFADP